MKTYGNIFIVLCCVLAEFAPLTARQVKSFDEMKDVETYEELKDYGLVVPNSTDHVAGTNLILLALKVNVAGKGHWVPAHGLLGVSMLNVSVQDRIGYQNLFLSIFDRSKYYNSASNENSWIWPGSGDCRVGPFKFVKTASILVKRENLIAYLAYEVSSRFEFDREGNYARIYRPDNRLDSKKRIASAITAAQEVLTELKRQGLDDICLKNLIGICLAQLLYDGSIQITFEKLPFPIQVYSDALKATIERLKARSGHSMIFLKELYWEMAARGISDYDPFLLPPDEATAQAIQEIISTDLKHIEKK